MSEVLLKQLIHEVKSLRARMNALETAEVIPSQLQASDGDPNPALSADASGNLTAVGNIYLPDGGTFGITGNELLTVNAAGSFVFSGAKVGIGGTPQVLLHLNSSGTTALRIESAAGAARDYDIETEGDNLTINGVGGSSGVLRIGENGVPSVLIDLGTGVITADGCLADGTCEIMDDKDAIAIIADVLAHDDGTVDEHGHKRMDMNHIGKNHPYLTTELDGKHYDKLGAKSDLLYVAVTQLAARLDALENPLLEA